ncbi:DUF4328 domain-containing protein [Streptomyces sp. NPDC001903]|uniref:DUF4328 domain-containing protein n=1 Tax=Streptomyces sp. NPDC001903 TaxID=3364622 RepID=UPI0036B7474C
MGAAARDGHQPDAAGDAPHGRGVRRLVPPGPGERGSLRPQLFRRGPGWAIGIWFIPFVGWTFLAYGIATGVWAAGAPKSSRAAAPLSAAPVTAWSVSFGAAMLASLVSGRMGAAAETQAGLPAAELVAMASDLLFVVAAGFAVVFVRKVSAMQARA